MSKLTWTRVDKDIRSVDALPIRLRKWKGTYNGDYWTVQVPTDADTDYPDGWAWADAWIDHKPGYPERMEAGTRLPDAMRYVAEHLEQILDYAAQQRSGWPHLAGVPVGQYIASYAPTGERMYASSEPIDAPEPGNAIVLTPGQPPQQVLVDHVTDDDVRRRLAGVQLPRTAGTLGTADIGQRVRITGPLAWGDDATEGKLSVIRHKPGPDGPLTQLFLYDGTKATVPGDRPVEVLTERCNCNPGGARAGLPHLPECNLKGTVT